MKEAAEVNKQRNDMHMEKRTRDKTIRDALVRGEGRGRGGGGEGEGVAAFISISHGIHMNALIAGKKCSVLPFSLKLTIIFSQNVLRGLKREIAEKAQEKKALEQRREECIAM